ncbi:MAG: hydroxyacid dehydrogenase [Oscillospiraceae bacterium]|nr:hydroxyacid dehydrogenase [Oscillospiraceae bacterium]
MNILITGAWQEAEKYIETIEKMGHQVQFLQYEKDELSCEYEWVEGIIGNGVFLTHPIEKFINLKYIQLTSAGYDRVPMDYVEQHCIEIHNARGVYSIPMAEFAMSGVLQFYKQSGYFHNNQKEHKWEKHRGLIELYGRTVCIVGCGSVGCECAKRFRAFGCSVIGIDIAPFKSNDFDYMYPIGKLCEVLSKSDVTVLTLPLCSETNHFMDSERLGKMKKGSLLVNIARGAVVDTKELEKALKNNLGGAVLDVFENEPLESNNPLWNMQNVIVTPHNSFIGDKNNARLSELVINNLTARK